MAVSGIEIGNHWVIDSNDTNDASFLSLSPDMHTMHPYYTRLGHTRIDPPLLSSYPFLSHSCVIGHLSSLFRILDMTPPDTTKHPT